MFSKPMISDMLAVKYRKLKRIAYLFASLRIARNIWGVFSAFKADTNNRLQYSSQTLSLQEFLRIKFSNLGINIVNDFSTIEASFDYWLYEDQAPQYNYFLAEGQDPEYDYFLIEEANVTLYFDFIIEVPVALSGRENEIKACTNMVKLASKRYKIVLY